MPCCGSAVAGASGGSVGSAPAAIERTSDARATLPPEGRTIPVLMPSPRTRCQIDASDQGAVLARESDQVASGINYGDVVRNSDARGCGFACLQHPLCIIQRQTNVRS